VTFKGRSASKWQDWYQNPGFLALSLPVSVIELLVLGLSPSFTPGAGAHQTLLHCQWAVSGSANGRPLGTIRQLSESERGLLCILSALL
jgi:hypothetical protein